MKPQNFPESLVWYSIITTYGLYLIGGLYLVGPAIAWILLVYLCKQLLEQQTSSTPPAEKIVIPWPVWVWIVGMLIELVALFMGHLDFHLGMKTLIKSSIGWAKGWALMAIFPLLGCLKIRPQLLYRAVCIVGLQTIVLTPLLVLAYLVKLKPFLYVAPLKILGPGANTFFQVWLYLQDGESARWPFFGPWAPATGIVGNIYFFMALQEQNKKWRWCGVIGGLLLCYLSKSRMAALCLPVVLLTTWALRKLARPVTLIVLGMGAALASILMPLILDAATGFWENFEAGRPDSSRVRDTLQRIALFRWQEAPIWGHGVVEPGPKIVEGMPIGTHHTIFSLLFVKGIVGVIAFVVPVLSSLIVLLSKAQKSDMANVGLSIILVLAISAFGDNLEILAYVYWPGLLVLGMALQEKVAVPSPPALSFYPSAVLYSKATR